MLVINKSLITCILKCEMSEPDPFTNEFKEVIVPGQTDMAVP